ncbi:MAG: dihydroorotate dehydrogenase (quinone) [Acinetobacter sp. GWC1_38_13]|jgi:dihydroorotate dehydrogenase|uniref:Dihydroorotate dehydrogenase (quinone) n=1 Tax=Acinetobacter junii CIP 107470 = MTCC 11364 TaxID=1217666 RepID=S7WWK1_ACIJU|nr:MULTISPECIES: quinone-dependent dihydroorotate dehydrogenase [Acinetobacter]MBQ1494680.1 quinone-dependent dihydroorotate dehydrogenase [Acinetobacter sp.]ENV50795.1 dihydroorotate dehydrogenase [Acinetobacter junii CIP 107470 = MTCC 11364]EPR86347.1 Dihydroorotate dehydrogenase [Acinetobacter junii CIP 107470 = MTCC 11364]MDA3502490.1 quinone-dependent dihydroorotate dehydrogenase [Acinetobacter sp. AOR34_HL]MDH0719777.1 quinone-dependent dihydroorotate dehydrogenase [Acinetobacter junii]
MLYSLARPLLFTLAPERAHELTLSMLDKAYKLGFMHQKVANKPVTCMGIEFPNPVGLAAGLDKNGAHIDALAALGFGFIEIGTITPRPQAGNPQPRLFRIPEAKAIINRMGFNNDGVDKLVENVKASKFKGILGINIGKNADTPVEDAVSDYLICLEKVYNYASYITVNISSPNTKNLRSLQSGDALTELLQTLKDRQLELAEQYNHYVPLVLKVAPDLTIEDINFISTQLLKFKIDGLIVTNTTLGREGVENLLNGNEAGGLSGAPVFEKSTECLRQFSKILDGRMPLIGVGGIVSGDQAVIKQQAGASLIQVYSGLIYTGPTLVKDCVDAMTV